VKRVTEILKNKKNALPLAFLLFVFFCGVAYSIQQLWFPALDLEQEPGGCLLEYGQWECVESRSVLPFHNGGEMRVTFTSVVIPVKSGEDIYNVSEVLEPGQSETLTTSDCGELSGEVFSLKWCCGSDCFTAPMNNPSQSITVQKQVTSG